MAVDALTPTVWSYWEGPQPAWIELCLETLRRHIPQVEILTPASVPGELLLDISPAELGRQRPNVKSDFLRASLLYHRGGIWIDADCIVFRDVRPIWKMLRQSDFVAYEARPGAVTQPSGSLAQLRCTRQAVRQHEQPRREICTALIASYAGGDVAREYYQEMVRILNTPRAKPLPPCTLGPRILWRALEVTGRQPALIPQHLVHPEPHWLSPDPGRQCRAEAEGQFAIHPDAYCWMLTHKALGEMNAWDRAALLASRGMPGLCWRKALA